MFWGQSASGGPKHGPLATLPSMTPDSSGWNPGLSVGRKKIYEDADQSGQSDRVRKHGAEQVALFALLSDRRARYDDRLSVDHFSHDAPGRIRRRHQDRAQAQPVGRDHLQTAEQRVRTGVGAGQRDAQPSEHGSEEWK